MSLLNCPFDVKYNNFQISMLFGQISLVSLNELLYKNYYTVKIANFQV